MTVVGLYALFIILVLAVGELIVGFTSEDKATRNVAKAMTTLLAPVVVYIILTLKQI